ncbi:hypothetical protein EXIGLDRAFT_763924 [Exidia glandulosa HHB12029]|uniref:Uncharacterized protein n=1 Tax=Exidia glandulosa HHB12029 TaxID=1314781 RepID=A0A165LMJ2_EXIGL|nr:hypothetical protein EXIGLDRAFT_763924 [Exidia glandulosa HHB12029]
MSHLVDIDPSLRAAPLRFQDITRNDGSPVAGSSRRRDVSPVAGSSRRRDGSPMAGSSRRRPRSTRRGSASSVSRPDESSSQASVQSKRGSLASRLSSPPPPNVRPPLPAAVHEEEAQEAAWEFVIAETDDTALREFESRAHDGTLPTHEARVRFAMERCMAFNTGRERVLQQVGGMDMDAEMDILMTVETEVHHVPPSLAITDTLPVADRYAAWERGVREVLARPHGRAAILRGGLIARIAIEFGLTAENALQGPSDSAYDIPNDRVILAPGGRTLVDDYLGDSEIAILLGQVGFHNDSLWPDEATFRSNGWDGVWTDWHEAWFTETLAILRSPVCPTSRRDQWRSTMRQLRYRSRSA